MTKILQDKRSRGYPEHSPKHFTFWESRFTVIKPKRNEHGTRFYTNSDIEKISMIHYLVKERGLKLDAAQEQIRANPKGVERKHLTVARLKQMREQVMGLLNALKSIKRQ